MNVPSTSIAATGSATAPKAGQRWYQGVTTAQWRAFWATFLGWVLDGFDFTIVSFLLVDIQHSFTVSKALAGALGTVTLFFRIAGGIGAGTVADRWGRKGPLMFSILWYSLFSFLGGFSTLYRVLFACRALFGIGMGGVWAAGMPLTLEHWPPNRRGVMSGLLQGGYSVGFILSAIVYQFGYPLVNGGTDMGWRVMLWIGILPAFLVLWIMSRVPESPVWLQRRQDLKDRSEHDTMSLLRLFHRGILPTTIHASLIMAAFLFFYYAISFWYPTYLGLMGRATLPYLIALNIGNLTGNVFCGRMSETRLGRRGASSLAALAGILVIPLYLYAASPSLLWVGALMMGFFGAGSFGIVPSYLTERFPTAARAAGTGFAYHVGAGVASFAPFLVGSLQDRGLTLPAAMAACIAGSGLLLIALLWLGPETRGRSLEA